MTYLLAFMQSHRRSVYIYNWVGSGRSTLTGTLSRIQGQWSKLSHTRWKPRTVWMLRKLHEPQHGAHARVACAEGPIPWCFSFVSLWMDTQLTFKILITKSVLRSSNIHIMTLYGFEVNAPFSLTSSRYTTHKSGIHHMDIGE